ncbi:MAG: class I SAM-dependent methyltransferase [Sphingomonadaceae bacterium]
MNDAHGFDPYSKWRNSLALPLKPDAAMVDLFCDHVARHDGHVLVLGMTPEICRAGRKVTIAEWNASVIARSSPKHHPDARTVQIDWREMEFAPETFDAAIGDGSLATLRWPEDYAIVLDRLASCMKPGAPLVVRCYVAPDVPEPWALIREDAMAGRIATFQALKWRVAMAIAGEFGGNLPVTEILATFDALFPDREALSQAAGWPVETIAEIDGYRTMTSTEYSFVTRAQIATTVPDSFVNVRFESSGEYPLSERCPFLVCERTG